MAVAGFGADEVELTQHGPELTVTGQKKPEQNDRQVLYRGLAVGNFKQVFKLADYVKVAQASMENGLLSIDLVREIPDEMKPRRIAVQGANSTGAAGKVDQIAQDLQPGRKAA